MRVALGFDDFVCNEDSAFVYTNVMIMANGVPRPPRILRSQAQPVVLLMLLTHETAV